ncbi:hypothetical protein HanXRQr2_Chr02g0072601 [Helianthus annuus]|uniref:Uncharacterized protein n=1 Tax=Helianthus annuus TaxID=4232 RepID=A0A9K3P1L0_HELAN|nr:hypothetical protein HanXRQr2_Chr02g0072601 [Helianthus annuus]
MWWIWVVEVEEEGRGLKRLEDMGRCLHQEEVWQTFFNERSAKKQTSCRTQRFARVCAMKT